MSDTDFLLESRGDAQDLGAWVIGLAFGRDGGCAFALGDGTVRLADGWRTVAAHDGACLSICADAKDGVLTGGDDGRLMHIAPDGTSTEVAKYGSKWVDRVAAHESGLRAAAVGKAVHILDGKGAALKSLAHPSTVTGIAFDAKGKRIAASHYNGASLWFPNAGDPAFYEWKGSHLGVTFSADNRFLVTSMHESALHGWRLADSRHMRMTGYPARVRSMSWSAGGKFLATSGSDSVILWPFASKDGPMGKEPLMLAPLQAKATVVACNPKEEVFAVGYSDGTILMVRIEDGAEILVRRNAGEPVAALAWNAKGSLLAFATEDGDAGLLTL